MPRSQPAAPTRSVHRIGSVAAAFGLSTRAVRYYEARGLVHPVRSAAGYRLYDAQARDALAFIADAKAVGLALGEIRSVLDLHRTGQSPCVYVDDLLAARITQIDEQRTALARLRQQLAEMRDRRGAAVEAPVRICGMIERAPPHR